MKVLNLDKFVGSEKRQLVIAGKTFPVDEMSVDNFIQTTKAAEALKDETDVSVQIEATIEMILRTVPTMVFADLAGLSLVQLQAIVAFVRGDAVEGAEEVAEGDAPAGK